MNFRLGTQLAQKCYRNQLGFVMEQRVDGGVVNPITEPAINTRQTLGLLWLKNNVVPTDWDEQHELFDGFDASNGLAMFLVSAVAAQPSARNPHEIEGSSVGQPPVKWRKERILGAGGQKNGGISDSPTTHRRPEPRQHWRSGQKKSQPIGVGISNYGGDGWN